MEFYKHPLVKRVLDTEQLTWSHLSLSESLIRSMVAATEIPDHVLGHVGVEEFVKRIQNLGFAVSTRREIGWYKRIFAGLLQWVERYRDRGRVWQNIYHQIHRETIPDYALIWLYNTSVEGKQTDHRVLLKQLFAKEDVLYVFLRDVQMYSRIPDKLTRHVIDVAHYKLRWLVDHDPHVTSRTLGKRLLTDMELEVSSALYSQWKMLQTTEQTPSEYIATLTDNRPSSMNIIDMLGPDADKNEFEKRKQNLLSELISYQAHPIHIDLNHRHYPHFSGEDMSTSSLMDYSEHPVEEVVPGSFPAAALEADRRRKQRSLVSRALSARDTLQSRLHSKKARRIDHLRYQRAMTELYGSRRQTNSDNASAKWRSATPPE